MKRLLKLSSVGLAFAMMLSTAVQAQEEQPNRDGAGRDRGQQGQRDGRRGDGERRDGQRGGQRGGRGGFRGTPGGGGGFGGFSKMMLIAAKPVQEELKLGEDELFFINKLLEDQRTEMRELFTGIDFRSLPEDERRAKFEELGKKRAELAKESEKGLSEFLTDEQSKRLDEIVVQLTGIRALSNEDIAKKLKLTSDQKGDIKEAFESADTDRRKMFEEARASGGGFEGMREKMEEARRKTDAKVLAVLSDDQKKQFDGLKGKPFEVDRRALFSFGGRGGQQQGRGGDRGQGRGRGDDRRRRPDSEGDGERPQRPAADE